MKSTVGTSSSSRPVLNRETGVSDHRERRECGKEGNEIRVYIPMFEVYVRVFLCVCENETLVSNSSGFGLSNFS